LKGARDTLRCLSGSGGLAEGTYVKEVQDDAHDLLLVEVVKHFCHQLDNVQGEVTEAGNGEAVVRQDPERADGVVGNLTAVETVAFEQVDVDFKAPLVDEFLGKFVCLEQEHEAVGEADRGQLAAVLEQVAEELTGGNRTVLVLDSFDQDGQHMSG